MEEEKAELDPARVVVDAARLFRQKRARYSAQQLAQRLRPEALAVVRSLALDLVIFNGPNQARRVAALAHWFRARDTKLIARLALEEARGRLPPVETNGGTTGGTSC